MQRPWGWNNLRVFWGRQRISLCLEHGGVGKNKARLDMGAEPTERRVLWDSVHTQAAHLPVLGKWKAKGSKQELKKNSCVAGLHRL